MIPLFVRQLSYIAEKQSYAAISRTTGIPYRTVLAMRTGTIGASTTAKRALRNMYQREAYGRLRETGYSSSQARRWSWYKPERVVVNTYSLRFKIGELATGALAAKFRQHGIPTSIGAVSEMYDDMYERVKKGIIRSIEPSEIWFDY